MSDPREKVRRLIALATAASAAPGEAGNAALAAVRLIAKHDLLGPAPAAAQNPFRGHSRNPWDDLEDMMREARQKQERADAERRKAHEAEANRVHQERERAAARARADAAAETAKKHAAAAKAREQNPKVQGSTFTGADGREYRVWAVTEPDGVTSAHVRADRSDTAKKAGVPFTDDFNAAVREAFKVNYPDGFVPGKQQVRMPPIDFGKINFDAMPFAGVNHPSGSPRNPWAPVEDEIDARLENVSASTKCAKCGKAIDLHQGARPAWVVRSGGHVIYHRCCDCGAR